MAGDSNDSAILDRVRTEIETVHAFIAAWFQGTVERSDQAFNEQLADRLAPDLVNIQPSGLALTRAVLLASIRDGYGANPAFAITIEDCTLRHVSADGHLALATYTEHQAGAKNTDPPINLRVSTVLFALPLVPAHPTWLHIHETGFRA